MTTARYGRRLSAFTPRNIPGTHFHYRLSRPQVWSEGNMSLKNPMTTPGIDPGTVRLVAQRLNHYATPGPYKWVVMLFLGSYPIHVELSIPLHSRWLVFRQGSVHIIRSSKIITMDCIQFIQACWLNHYGKFYQSYKIQ